ncbi:enoyl-CoA hydratase/isomerase family protein, partial [Acinetobacter baumannii]
DVGGGYFLSRAPGQIGAYLGLTGEIINAADALYAGLADVYIPTSELPTLFDLLAQTASTDIRSVIHEFAASFSEQAHPETSKLATQRAVIDENF